MTLLEFAEVVFSENQVRRDGLTESEARPNSSHANHGAGALDDDPGVTPAFSVHFGSRSPWYVHVSDLEMHETIPQS
jgi:hypothetical protein